MSRKDKRERRSARRFNAAGGPRAHAGMTARGKTGPRRVQPMIPARVRACVDNSKASPVLVVGINGRETRSTCDLPIGEILARVHSSDLLDELLRRLPTPDFTVYRDWLESRGDPLGPALSIFTEQLAMLRRGRTPPTQ